MTTEARSGTPARGTGLRACARPPVQVYDAAMFDLDGVVYVSGAAVAGSPRHIDRAVRAGMTLAFVTNNASRPPEQVAERLRRLGVACKADDVVTSAQAAARLVARRVPAGSRVLVVGGDGLEQALAEHGLRAVRDMSAGPAAVAQGFSPDVDWRLLAEGAVAVAAGLPWIASNTDLTLPSNRGRLPGNGQLVEVIARTTGRSPQVAGKPQTPLFEETMLRVGARHPLVVGDRLDTDIEGAVRCDVDSLLVLTGVTDVADLATAAPGCRPSFVADDLDGLFRPHPVPEAVGDGYRCGGWTAAPAREGGRVLPRLDGDGESIDALRALVTLCWAQRDDAGVTWTGEVVDTAWESAVGRRRALP